MNLYDIDEMWKDIPLTLDRYPLIGNPYKGLPIPFRAMVAISEGSRGFEMKMKIILNFLKNILELNTNHGDFIIREFLGGKHLSFGKFMIIILKNRMVHS